MFYNFCVSYLQNCSSNRGECLLVTCNITGLQGQGRTSARVTVGGYVDQRFFAVRSGTALQFMY